MYRCSTCKQFCLLGKENEVKNNELLNHSFVSFVPSMPQNPSSQGGSHEGRRKERRESVRGSLSQGRNPENIHSKDD